jgi:UTP-glucose-1-phosphate uridylyltransferase
MKPALLILAAGMGSRYGGLKQLDAVGPSGETILEYSVYDAIRAGFGKVVFVIRKSFREDFKKVFMDKLASRIEVDCVLQEIDSIPPGFTVPEERQKPWGTGHAILMAKDVIDVPFAVINADDFYSRSAFLTLAEQYKTWQPGNGSDWCMVGYDLANTLSEHGFVSRGVCRADASGFLVDIVERTKIQRTPAGIGYQDEKDSAAIIPGNTIVSMNFWGFTPSLFGFLETGFKEFLAKNQKDPKSEYFIPSVVNGLIRNNTVTVKVLKCGGKWFGVTYREDRGMVVDQLKKLVGNGIYPQDLWK